MIKINNLNFSYGNGFNLNIEKLNIKAGEFVSIIGPNGSGKSTLLKILSGILKNFNGEILIKNKNIKNFNYKELAKTISIVPQEFNTIFKYDVESIISTSRVPYSKTFSFFETMEDKKIIEEAMKKTDTIKYKNKFFSNLSGGEKQRVMIARALAQKTKILFLDEFTSHLDPGHAQSLMNIVKENTQNGHTVVAVFHDINLASIYSKRLIIMLKGNVVCDGSPIDVITQENIKDIYNLDGSIIKHPKYNVPQIVFN
ncbi:ABC transporter [Tepiditoga spiralis]|uniref:ABC transporter n=1 Tax=Tepiditoga spiralis TaxID=2108365 RepID=A0A7G1G6S8_9BACT|nr:ABC transporter ATP-binding protein [Tepiditoga spiralis]BBE31066.1 ABC transporter [Tepiditoga spiralis]